MEYDPAIISYGRTLIGNYPEADFPKALRRAFFERGADYVVLDDNRRGQGFLSACAAWAIDKGWLYCDRYDVGDQGAVSTYRLTEHGASELRKEGEV